MTDIVVYLDPVQNNGGTACFIRAPSFDIDNPHAVSIIRLDDVTQLNGPDVIRQIGEALAKKIRENEAVRTVLDRVFTLASAPPSLPIHFRAADPTAHALSWEALVGNDNFIALDDRWPVARIARGGNVKEDARRPFRPPLRLVCVLSAVGRSGLKEWRALYESVQVARQTGLPIKVTLFSGDEKLLAAADALRDRNLTALPVPEPEHSLVEVIESHQPHILHMFCHGSIRSGVRWLEVGTIVDFDRDDGASSVLVRPEELGVAVRRVGAWAAVLNTCRGAEAMDEILTHAEEIVSNGVPVAIGMRRQVDVDDASAFTAAFYPSIFRILSAAVAAGAGDRIINWVDALSRARRRLRDIHGADPSLHDAWTMPVLYTRPGKFTLQVAEKGISEEQTHRDMGEAAIVASIVDLVLGAGDADNAVLKDIRALSSEDGT